MALYEASYGAETWYVEDLGRQIIWKALKCGPREECWIGNKWCGQNWWTDVEINEAVLEKIGQNKIITNINIILII